MDKPPTSSWRSSSAASRSSRDDDNDNWRSSSNIRGGNSDQRFAHRSVSRRGSGSSRGRGRGNVTGATSSFGRQDQGFRHIQRNRSKPFDSARLVELLDSPEFTAIQSIQKDLDEWKTLLKKDVAEEGSHRSTLFAMRSRPTRRVFQDDELILAVYILGEKVCSETTVLGTAQTEILAASNCEKFVDKITDKFMRLIEHGPEYQPGLLESAVPWDLVRFVRCLVNIGRFMSRTMKTSAVSFVTRVYPGGFAMFSTWEVSEISDELQSVKQELEELHREKEKWEEVLNQERSQGTRARALSLREQTEREFARLHNEPPPDNFRYIPVVPDAAELRSPELSFLRPLIVSGAYHDVDHYLDVQFRLLREDFVRPLKDGIQEYLESKNQNSTARPQGNLCFYEDVVLLETEYLRGEKVQHVQLPEKFKKIQWTKSKRLLNGNLLVFTPDDFKTALFAVVQIREDRELTTRGTFGVTWHGSSMFVDLSRWDKFLMVESEVYFEAYRHTLEILKTLDLERFQLSKFIVEVSTDVGAPKYLQPSTVMRIDDFAVSPLDLKQWPSARDLGLDDKQYAAYQACLTREFAIVQGPPGTGKTFLGKKVVETLLRNQSSWRDHEKRYTREVRRERMFDDSDDEWHGDFGERDHWIYELVVVEPGGPILIVCYTNHALDQFLEGILEIFSRLNQTPNMIRVGGKSSDPEMNQFSLHERRKVWSTQRYEWLEAADLRRAGGILRCAEEDYAYATAELKYLKRSAGIVLFEELLFKDDLLSERDEIDKDEIPHIRNWIKNCSTLDYFGYDKLVFTNASQKDVDELIFQRFGVRPETDGNVTNTGGTTGPSRFRNMSKYSNAEVLEGACNEDYDHDELMQKRLMEENDEDYTLMSTSYGVLQVPDLCGRAIQPLREKLEDCEKKLRRLLSPSPPNSDSNEDELQEIQRNKSYEITGCRDSIKTLRRQISPLLAFKKYVIGILNLEKKRKLDFPVPFDSIFRSTSYSMLTHIQRWGVYFWLLRKARSVGDESYSRRGRRLKRDREHWQDLRNELDGQLLNEALIVGMTTTGAAKYNSLLRRAQAKIVIVEEAAEVLESHIVTCITPACQQLILIGDHQQLRPSTNVHELAVKYHLDISLFERMVKNNLNCLKLDVQHRMRPEIADLVVGSIYDKLRNAPKVHDYPQVMGVRSNLFFLSHNHAEDGVEDGRSKSNEFEAEFLIAFCNYLVQQGYSESQITILTTYTGQMFLLKKVRGEYLREVRITCVDNFQGEENDIILLSLVRNNEAGNIGFLRTDNRVCVALSRAKHGLFIIGNIDQLSQRTKTWRMISEKLQKAGNLGTSLSIRCQNHNTVNDITSAVQFEECAPKGGCMLLCSTPLECGHICRLLCHVVDRYHVEYQCWEPCTLSCIRNHGCRAKCYQDCPNCLIKLRKTPACGHSRMVECYRFDWKIDCTTLVTRELPCKHLEDMACFIDPKAYNCTAKIIRALSCGHEKEMQCSTDIADVVCKVMLEKTLLCGHTQMEQCNIAVEDVKCVTEVEVQFPHCEHTKKKKCSSPDPESCSMRCSGQLDCGHRCSKDCHPEEDPQHLRYKCEMPCARQCTKGHKCKESHNCGRPCQPCKEKVPTELQCGHQRDIECHRNPASVTCLDKCTRKLDCGHECQNECYEDCGPCEVTMNKRNPCGHSFLVKCSEPVTSSANCEIMVPAPLKAPCGHEVTIPCGKRLEVSRLKLEQYCTAPDCDFRVPKLDRRDLDQSEQFLPDDAMVTEMDQLSLYPRF